jgi:hypothetical protein
MFRYTSILALEYSKELEELLFFNSGQRTVYSAIEDSIEMFGAPFVFSDGEHLRVNVRKLNEIQTLFALDGDILAGLLLYTRVSPERLTAIHIAVGEEYSLKGKFSDKMLVVHLSQQLRECARRIKGIETIRILYGSNRTRDYPVRRDVFR